MRHDDDEIKWIFSPFLPDDDYYYHLCFIIIIIKFFYPTRAAGIFGLVQFL